MENNRIRLSSQAAFVVYKGLSFEDKSLDIEKAKIVSTAQLIRVLPTFTSTSVRIRKGTHSYDANILEWPTIRQFIKQGVIDPVGFSLDEYINKQEVKNVKQSKAKKDKDEDEEVEVKKKSAKADTPSLDSLT